LAIKGSACRGGAILRLFQSKLTIFEACSIQLGKSLGPGCLLFEFDESEAA